jgi:hypothetical protein
MDLKRLKQNHPKLGTKIWRNLRTSRLRRVVATKIAVNTKSKQTWGKHCQVKGTDIETFIFPLGQRLQCDLVQKVAKTTVPATR